MAPHPFHFLPSASPSSRHDTSWSPPHPLLVLTLSSPRSRPVLCLSFPRPLLDLALSSLRPLLLLHIILSFSLFLSPLFAKFYTGLTLDTRLFFCHIANFSAFHAFALFSRPHSFLAFLVWLTTSFAGGRLSWRRRRFPEIFELQHPRKLPVTGHSPSLGFLGVLLLRPIHFRGKLILCRNLRSNEIRRINTFFRQYGTCFPGSWATQTRWFWCHYGAVSHASGWRCIVGSESTVMIL